MTGVLLPASALFLGRPMPPGRALVDAGALVALATDFNPGSAFCDSLPLVLSLACTQLKLAPEEALVGGDRQCRPRARARRPDRSPRARATQPTSCCSTLRDWRHVAYHLAGDVVHTVVEDGAVAFRRTA